MTLPTRAEAAPASLTDAGVVEVFARAAARESSQRPFPSPVDWRDHPIYMLMLDRFNNPEKLPVEQENVPFGGYQGGTFRGAAEKMGYIRDLGFGAVWISPVLKQLQWDEGAYHGYAAYDFLTVNPRFASDVAAAQADPSRAEDEFRALVDAAHTAGLYVILDIVYNHAGNLFGYASGGGAGGNGEHVPFESGSDPLSIFWRDESGIARSEFLTIPPDPSRQAFVWPQELQRNEFFRRRGKESGDDLTGDFFSLKEFVTDSRDAVGRSVLRDALIRAYQFVIARYDVDGFRIDTIKHVEPEFSQIFANAIREYALSIGKANFFTFGEARGSNNDSLARFVGRETEQAGQPVGVDAALDFPLFSILPGYAKAFGEEGTSNPGTAPGEVFELFRERREIQKGRLSTHGDASHFFVTFLDTHDDNGFRFTPGDPAFSPQFGLGFGLLMGLQGIPCVYYGTELGLPGMGQNKPEAVREAFWGQTGAFSTTGEYYLTLKHLLQLRRDEPALRFGRQYFRPLSGDKRVWGLSPFPKGVLAVSRILNDREVILVANPNTRAGATVTLHVLVDHFLNPAGSPFRLLYSNLAVEGRTPPGVAEVSTDPDIAVFEPEGGIRRGGPVTSVAVRLRPMEFQVIGQ